MSVDEREGRGQFFYPREIEAHIGEMLFLSFEAIR